MSKFQFEVTLKRTYFHIITVEVENDGNAEKIAKNTSWQIEDAESCEDDIESIDEI